MAKPIKFRSKKSFKIVNRCIMCGKIIPIHKAICDTCNSCGCLVIHFNDRDGGNVQNEDF